MAALTALLALDADGLACARGGFHVDPEGPVPLAVITHGHADHARPGAGAYLCAEPGLGVLRKRLGPDATIRAVPYGEAVRVGEVEVSFHPAGHVLGSAQVRVDGGDGVWVVSGDFKRDPDPTCAPFEPVPCDVFVTEATFALPVFRWPDPDDAIRGVLAWWDANAAAGRPSVLLAYALGKAQRVLSLLAPHLAGRGAVVAHGAIAAMNEVYRDAGVSLPWTAFATDDDVDLRGALVLAPPGAEATPWILRFKDAEIGMASGWMRLRGPRRRRTLSHGAVISDHADWPALLRTVADSGASRVLVTHGYVEPFVRALAEAGVDAAALRTGWRGEPEAEGGR